MNEQLSNQNKNLSDFQKQIRVNFQLKNEFELFVVLT